MIMRSILWTVIAITATLAPAQTATFECRFTDAQITIDGVLDEPVWQTLDAIPLVVPVTFEDPRDRTIGRICWNESTLFVALSASDEDLYAIRTHDETDVFRDDAMEIFLQPGPIEWGYHNLEINALGSMLDQHGGGHGTDWDCQGMELAITLDGTMNDASDTDRGWILEASIPFAALIPGQDVQPHADSEWRFHLARLNYPSRNPEERELSSCARLTRPWFHQFPDWAVMRFVR